MFQCSHQDARIAGFPGQQRLKLAEQTKFGRMVSSQSPKLELTFYAFIWFSCISGAGLFGERPIELYLAPIVRKKTHKSGWNV